MFTWCRHFALYIHRKQIFVKNKIHMSRTKLVWDTGKFVHTFFRVSQKCLQGQIEFSVSENREGIKFRTSLQLRRTQTHLGSKETKSQAWNFPRRPMLAADCVTSILWITQPVSWAFMAKLSHGNRIMPKRTIDLSCFKLALFDVIWLNKKWKLKLWCCCAFRLDLSRAVNVQAQLILISVRQLRNVPQHNSNRHDENGK